jgi:hypothetical protein
MPEPKDPECHTCPSWPTKTGTCCVGTDHEPTPFFGTGVAIAGGAGVRCSCGAVFTIGDSRADTPKGNPSRRRLATMKHCWDAYREHWARSRNAPPI